MFCCCYKCMLDFNYLPSYLGMVLALPFHLISATTKAGNFFLLFFFFFLNRRHHCHLLTVLKEMELWENHQIWPDSWSRHCWRTCSLPKALGFSDLPWHGASLRITHHLPAGQSLMWWNSLHEPREGKNRSLVFSSQTRSGDEETSRAALKKRHCNPTIT